MLAGIYYGAQYGGSTTSILVNLPVESSSVVTALDGFQMAKQGRAGPALAIAAIGSFFAGCVATALFCHLEAVERRHHGPGLTGNRSEERRVGEEGRSRWAPDP